MVERNYQSLQEEVDDMRKLIQKLRVKYKQGQNEVKDLNREHNHEKQEIFGQIKESERETVLYRMILQMFVPKLSIGDLNTIVANSEYDNDALTWNVVIPSSIQKKLNFSQTRFPNEGGSSRKIVKLIQEKSQKQIISGSKTVKDEE